MDDTQKSGILVVDDTKLMLDLMKSTLADSGYRIYTATNGSEALAVFAKQLDVTLIFCDITFQDDFNGFKILEALLEYRSSRQFRFCFITSHLDERVEAKARNCGADEFITKPIKPKELRKVTAKLMGESLGDNSEDAISLVVSEMHAAMQDCPVKPLIFIREITKHTILLECSADIQTNFAIKIFSPKLKAYLETEKPFFGLNVVRSLSVAQALKIAKKDKKKFRFLDADPRNYLIRCAIQDPQQEIKIRIEAAARRAKLQAKDAS